MSFFLSFLFSGLDYTPGYQSDGKPMCRMRIAVKKRKKNNKCYLQAVCRIRKAGENEQHRTVINMGREALFVKANYRNFAVFMFLGITLCKLREACSSVSLLQ